MVKKAMAKVKKFMGSSSKNMSLMKRNKINIRSIEKLVTIMFIVVLFRHTLVVHKGMEYKSATQGTMSSELHDRYIKKESLIQFLSERLS